MPCSAEPQACARLGPDRPLLFSLPSRSCLASVQKLILWAPGVAGPSPVLAAVSVGPCLVSSVPSCLKGSALTGEVRQVLVSDHLDQLDSRLSGVDKSWIAKDFVRICVRYGSETGLNLSCQMLMGDASCMVPQLCRVAEAHSFCSSMGGKAEIRCPDIPCLSLGETEVFRVPLAQGQNTRADSRPRLLGF